MNQAVLFRQTGNFIMGETSLFKLVGMKVLIGIIGFIVSIASVVMLAVYYYPG